MLRVTSSMDQLPHRLRRTAIAAGVAGALLAATACGSSGGSASTATVQSAALGKSEFVAKANAICAKADPLLSEAGARLASLHDRRQIASIVERAYVPAIETQVSQIRALGAPSGEQPTVARMLGLVLADLARLKRHPALVAGDVFADFARLAHPYGLTACAPLS